LPSPPSPEILFAPIGKIVEHVLNKLTISENQKYSVIELYQAMKIAIMNWSALHTEDWRREILVFGLLDNKGFAAIEDKSSVTAKL